MCDFRKIGGMEAYTPSDNVSELTARINDDGWDTTYANWLRGSHINAKDLVLVFSVGGGDAQRNISANPAARVAMCEGGGGEGVRRGEPRRRFHRLGGRCVLSDSGCEFPHCNSAYRSFPSASVAPVSLASEA